MLPNNFNSKIAQRQNLVFILELKNKLQIYFYTSSNLNLDTTFHNRIFDDKSLVIIRKGDKYITYRIKSHLSDTAIYLTPKIYFGLGEREFIVDDQSFGKELDFNLKSYYIANEENKDIIPEKVIIESISVWQLN